MINFIVVEDNEYHRKMVVNCIIKFMMQNKLDFKILEFEKETSELRQLIKTRKTNHIYVLDFELPNTNAIELARQIRENDWISPIIVFTVNGGMALETFKQRLQILDFISKQYEAERNLLELFDICLKQIDIKKSLKFTFKRTDYNIPFDKIFYIYRDSVERKCIAVTESGEYKIAMNISDVHKLLDENFKVTHKSCIVNTKRVKALDWKDGKIIFDDDTEIFLLSKTHKKELKDYVTV